MMNKNPMEQRVREEIESLHRFFVGWFSGSLPSDRGAYEAEFLSRFDPQFCLIQPGGQVSDCSAFERGIYTGHASNPDFEIVIRNVRLCREWDHYVLAMYEEWQRNAIASSPPDNGRISSVLFACESELKWLHVHETWLPRDTMESGLKLVFGGS